MKVAGRTAAEVRRHMSFYLAGRVSYSLFLVSMTSDAAGFNSQLLSPFKNLICRLKSLQCVIKPRTAFTHSHSIVHRASYNL